MLAAASLTGNEQIVKLCLLIVPWFVIAWVVAGVQLLANWYDKRSGRQLPPPPTRRGREPGQQDRGTGRDLILCEARNVLRLAV
jgi:hypothetical protein